MINKIKSLANTEDKKKLLGNFFSLSSLNLFSYILPLLTLPYLVRVLGTETFGIIVLAQTVVSFFSIIVDFGFNLSATREVSIFRDNKEKMIEIYSSILILKSILFLISLILFIVLISYISDFYNHFELYLITFISIINQILFPVWYFQGIEKMKYITIINIISKVTFTILIFIFVNKQSDYLLVPFLTGLGSIIGGLYSTYLIRGIFNQEFNFQEFKILKKHFLDGIQFFLSRISSIGYTNSNTLIIGLILSPSFVTYYHLADKVIMVALKIFDPVVQTIYPYLSKNFNQKFLLKLIFILILTAFAGIFIGYLVDEYISIVLIGEINSLFISVLNIMLILIPISVFYVMLGAPLLLARGFKKEFNLSIVYGFIIHLIILSLIYFYLLNNNLSEYELIILFSYSLVFSKSIVLFIRIYYVYINKLYYKG